MVEWLAWWRCRPNVRRFWGVLHHIFGLKIWHSEEVPKVWQQSFVVLEHANNLARKTYGDMRWTHLMQLTLVSKYLF